MQVIVFLQDIRDKVCIQYLYVLLNLTASEIAIELYIQIWESISSHGKYSPSLQLFLVYAQLLLMTWNIITCIWICSNYRMLHGTIIPLYSFDSLLCLEVLQFDCDSLCMQSQGIGSYDILLVLNIFMYTDIVLRGKIFLNIIVSLALQNFHGRRGYSIYWCHVRNTWNIFNTNCLYHFMTYPAKWQLWDKETCFRLVLHNQCFKVPYVCNQ